MVALHKLAKLQDQVVVVVPLDRHPPFGPIGPCAPRSPFTPLLPGTPRGPVSNRTRRGSVRIFAINLDSYLGAMNETITAAIVAYMRAPRKVRLVAR